jgi:predicted ArsR family transcriptional regulator
MEITVESQLDASWAAIVTDPVRLSVLLGLCRLEAATTAELRTLCHTSDPTIRRHLGALEALGLVREEVAERDGVTPGRPARRFRLDADAATSLSTLFELLRKPLTPVPGPARRLPRDR